MDPTTTITEVRVDLRIYPLIAVQKAVGALSRSCLAEVSQDAESTLKVTVRTRVGVAAPVDAGAELLMLINDFTLQEKIAEKTKDIRAALVRAAFHEALEPPTVTR